MIDPIPNNEMLTMKLFAIEHLNEIFGYQDKYGIQFGRIISVIRDRCVVIHTNTDQRLEDDPDYDGEDAYIMDYRSSIVEREYDPLQLKWLINDDIIETAEKIEFHNRKWIASDFPKLEEIYTALDCSVEWCQNCDSEVIIPNHIRTKCPSCNAPIISCNMCHGNDENDMLINKKCNKYCDTSR